MKFYVYVDVLCLVKYEQLFLYGKSNGIPILEYIYSYYRTYYPHINYHNLQKYIINIYTVEKLNNRKYNFIILSSDSTLSHFQTFEAHFSSPRRPKISKKNFQKRIPKNPKIQKIVSVKKTKT